MYLQKILIGYLLTIVLLGLALNVNAQLPSTNILQRVFAIRVGSSFGTAFTLDIDDKQYLVTVRHIFSDTASLQTISIFRDSIWLDLKVELVAPLSDSVDIAVLALTHQLSPTHELQASTKGMVFGQELFFFGFPSMLRTDVGRGANRGFPIPFIKQAIFSAQRLDLFGNLILYLDGHNNPGFSGGPVAYWHQKHKKLYLAGVVNSFRPEKLYELDSNKVYQPIEVFGNSGIVLATEISAVVKIIKQNPIGVQLLK